jgi:endoglucanase
MTSPRVCSFLLAALAVAAACGCEGAGKPPPDARCAAAPTYPVPAGGYYVNGNTICTADGRAHLLHGVDRPSLEWTSGGDNVSLADFQLMASWNPNVVRIGLNQDFWIAESPLFDPSYAGRVDGAIAWAETTGMDVILDLHWSDAGVLGGRAESDVGQQQMPDVNSVTFWSEVADRYQDDGRVMFELYNEPHDVSWSVWRSGGDTSDGFRAVGMQQLYDTVRATGAHNLVIIGGLDWAYDLSGVPANRIDGYNIVYATHAYNTPDRQPSDWDMSWGFLAETDPVIITEFGALFDETCATDYSAEVIRYADAHRASWTAWAWFPGGCAFPALIDDWAATPSPSGTVVKTALLGYGSRR